MFLQEPKIEFINIDMKDIITFSCNESTSSTNPSGEDCLNCDANMNNCSDVYEAVVPIIKITTWEPIPTPGD